MTQEEARRQGMQVASKCYRRKENGFFLGPLEGISNPSNLQICKIITLCSLKTLNL